MATDLDSIETFTASQLVHTRSIDYMRYLSCLYDADGQAGEAQYRFGLRYPRSLNLDLVMNTKAAVAVGVTTDSTWAGALAVLKPLKDALLTLVRPRTLLGRILNLRRVPFNVSVASQTTGGVYTWVGQNKPKPVTKIDYAAVTLGFAKVSGIIVMSEELADLSQPGAEVAARDELVAGISQFLDVQFIDPTIAEVVGVSPASVTNGATSIASSGATAANALTDWKAVNASFTAANPDFEFAVALMSPRNANALATAANSDTLTIAGGTFRGYPVVTSTALADNIVLMDAAGILVADNNEIEISASRSALVQLEDAPTDPVTAAVVYTSLFQRNLAGFRVDRRITWKRGRASAVRVLTGAVYT